MPRNPKRKPRARTYKDTIEKALEAYQALYIYM